MIGHKGNDENNDNERRSEEGPVEGERGMWGGKQDGTDTAENDKYNAGTRATEPVKKTSRMASRARGTRERRTRGGHSGTRGRTLNKVQCI